EGTNPARFTPIATALGKRRQNGKVQHHAALPYDEVGAFMRDVRSQDCIAAAALEFLILTAGRTAEVIHARWSEIDKQKTWNVPAERMKSGREHRVPFSTAALAVVECMRGQDGVFVFPGLKPGKPLSDMAMLNLLGRMGSGDITVHGFRSTFRDWAAERTN